MLAENYFDLISLVAFLGNYSVCVCVRARIRLSFVSDIHTRKKEKNPLLIFYCSRSGRCSGLSSVDMGEKKDYVPWVN